MTVPPAVVDPLRRAPVADLARRALAAGRAGGLDAVGIATADPFTDTRAHLEERRRAGLHGGMAFTYRNPARSTDPRALLPSAQALVAGARAYGGGDLTPPPGQRPQGRVARYAWGDHYAELEAGLEAVAEVLRADGWRAVVVADQNHLVDRAVAHRAGLGWYGKSSLLLLPGAGSWFVLGAVVTDAPLAPTAEEPVADGCGPCTRCLDGCPTGAIVAPGVVDARRCLAWVVQAPGPMPRPLRAALGDRIYGCDECQDVCPPNRVELRRHRRGEAVVDDQARAHDERSDRPWVDLLDLLAASDDELLDQHGRWYIAGRDPRWIRRNAVVALGNVGDPDDPAVIAALRVELTGPDDLLAAHAAWAARRLGRHDLLVDLDPDVIGPDLAAELVAPPPPPRTVGASGDEGGA
ncbi:MAG TPA: tRNA epoxyqueuosine(34) reductase QueG [Iamia sp.]|nr:tRNA epoxyqueuosine(34) reductase QueG [Iamia sp.]